MAKKTQKTNVEVVEVQETMEITPVEEVEVQEAQETTEEVEEVTETTEEAPKEAKKGKKEVEEELEAEDVEFEDVEEIKEMIKSLPNDGVYAWAEDLGLEVPDFEHEGIKRMRTAMAIKEYYFPTPKKEKAPTTSPWINYSTAELEKLVKSNKLKARKVENNDSIKRMWLIKALKDAGVEPNK